MMSYSQLPAMLGTEEVRKRAVVSAQPPARANIQDYASILNEGPSPFVINLIANLIFTPIQFGLRNLPLASIDIVIVWATIVWMVAAIWTYYRWVAIAQAPYLAWVSVATVLQLSITWMN